MAKKRMFDTNWEFSESELTSDKIVKAVWKKAGELVKSQMPEVKGYKEEDYREWEEAAMLEIKDTGFFISALARGLDNLPESVDRVIESVGKKNSYRWGKPKSEKPVFKTVTVGGYVKAVFRSSYRVRVQVPEELVKRAEDGTYVTREGNRDAVEVDERAFKEWFVKTHQRDYVQLAYNWEACESKMDNFREVDDSGYNPRLVVADVSLEELSGDDDFAKEDVFTDLYDYDMSCDD